MDQFEAAAKRHRMKEEARTEKKLKKIKEKDGTIEFKEEKADPEELKEEEIIDNSYDSEFEAEFFGQKDPELNKELGNLKGESESDSDDDD